MDEMPAWLLRGVAVIDKSVLRYIQRVTEDPDTKGEEDMNTYIVESWRPDTSDGSSKVSTRIMARQWNPTTTEHEWRYRRHTFNAWDWELDAIDNHHTSVMHTIRLDLPDAYIVEATKAGDTVRGYLWTVTTK